MADTDHNRILVYSPTGTLLARFGAGGGNGASGSGPGEFDHPEAVAVNGAGDMYVADTYNNRIVELSTAGAVLDEWGSRGTGDGRFHSPTGIALDAAGNVYVVDSENNRVEVFDPSGHFLQKWGERGIGPGEFSFPTAIAVDCAGDVYVADTNNNRVERFDLVSPFGSGCLAPGLWPPPLNVAPVLQVSACRGLPGCSRGTRSRRASSCLRGCKVLVSATLSSVRPRRTVELISAAATLAPKRVEELRIRLSRSALRTLQRALGRAPGHARARHDRRRWAHRPAHHRLPDLRRHALIEAWGAGQDERAVQRGDGGASSDNDLVSTADPPPDAEGPNTEHRQERVRIETERHRIEGSLTLARDGYRSRVSDVLNASRARLPDAHRSHRRAARGRSGRAARRI